MRKKKDARTESITILEKAFTKAYSILKKSGEKYDLYRMIRLAEDAVSVDQKPPEDSIYDEYNVKGKSIKGRTSKQATRYALKKAIKLALSRLPELELGKGEKAKAQNEELKAEFILNYILGCRRSREWLDQINCTTCASDHNIQVEFFIDWTGDCTEDKLCSHMDLNVYFNWDNCSLWWRIKMGIRKFWDVVWRKEETHDVCLDRDISSEGYRQLKDILNLL